MLEVDRLCAWYGDVQILRDVSFSVARGEVCALLGANGAGKTTTLRAISGLVEKRAGDVRLDGQSLTGKPAHAIVERGLIQVPEGRLLFPRMPVRDNLELGAYLPGPARQRQANLERVLAIFPVLKERLDTAAGQLSGGQQQMVAIGRALMSAPRLLMLDEPSLGLAPLVVDEIFAIVKRIAAEGMTVLLVEQNVGPALALAQQAFVLENGQVVLSGTARELAQNPRVREAYLGL